MPKYKDTTKIKQANLPTNTSMRPYSVPITFSKEEYDLLDKYSRITKVSMGKVVRLSIKCFILLNSGKVKNFPEALLLAQQMEADLMTKATKNKNRDFTKRVPKISDNLPKMKTLGDK